MTSLWTPGTTDWIPMCFSQPPNWPDVQRPAWKNPPKCELPTQQTTNSVGLCEIGDGAWEVVEMLTSSNWKFTKNPSICLQRSLGKIQDSFTRNSDGLERIKHHQKKQSTSMGLNPGTLSLGCQDGRLTKNSKHTSATLTGGHCRGRYFSRDW